MSTVPNPIDSMLQELTNESSKTPTKGATSLASDPDVDLWSATAKTNKDSTGGGSPLTELGSGAWEGVKNLASGFYDSAKWALSQDTPEQGEAALNALGAALNASDEQLAQAHDAWKRGDHVEALGHLGKSIPGFGPAVGTLGDIAGGTAPTFDANGREVTPFIPPRPWYAAGQAIPLIASIFTPDLVEGGVNVVGKTGQAIRNLGKINPEKYSARIFVPGEANATFSKTTPGALIDLRTYGNPNIENVPGSPIAETETAADQAINHLQGIMDAWVDHGMQTGARFDGNVLVNATRKAIPDLIWTRDPLHAQAIVDEAQAAFGGKTFPVDRVRDWLRTGNANKFYSQIGYKQNAASISGTAPAIEAAQTNAMREELYPQLDVANNGAGPREIQSRTSALINARNNAYRRIAQTSKEGAASTLEGMGNFATGITKVAGAPFQQGDIASSLRQIRNPMEGKSDAMLRALYKQLPQAPPLPLPPGYRPPPGGVLSGPGRFNPGYNPRQLAQGPALFSAQGTIVPDLAGDIQRGFGRTINQPALPPGRAPFTQGTIAINPSAMRGPAGAYALPAGSPWQGQGVIQVPPPGAAEWLHGPDLSYRQAGPFTPREAAAPADTSYVRGVPATPHPAAETPGVLPPSETQRVIDMRTQPAPRGQQAGPDWWAQQPLTKAELQQRYVELFNRAENLSPQRPVRVPETGTPEAMARRMEAQRTLAKTIGLPWENVGEPELNALNALIDEGYGTPVRPKPVSASKQIIVDPGKAKTFEPPPGFAGGGRAMLERMRRNTLASLGSQ